MSTYPTLAFANMMPSSVSASPLFRFAENAMPTFENKRSTAADDAGQPRYCRAMTATFGYFEACTVHQSIAACPVLFWICGSSLRRVDRLRPSTGRHGSLEGRVEGAHRPPPFGRPLSCQLRGMGHFYWPTLLANFTGQHCRESGQSRRTLAHHRRWPI